MKLHFGPYRGRRLQDCPREHLLWLARQSWLKPRLRESVETALFPDGAACLGPRWWYLRRDTGRG
jgi:uncharacterized protein (DUF3820 family)